MPQLNGYYRQPRYFSDFRCKGGDCPNTCCQGWLISWKEEEIEKVKSADISDELRAMIDTSFVPVKEEEKKVAGDGTHKVLLDPETERCPFLTEENLCRIQKEAGEDALSYTCKIYPRRFLVVNNIVYRSCYTTCTPVINALCSIENSTDLVNVRVTDKARFIADSDDTKKYPVLKYHEELLEFFYGILYNRKCGFETSVMLGALAAQKISEIVSSGQIDRIPEAIKAIQPQLRNEKQIKALDEIKPNFRLKMSFMGEMFKLIMRTDFLKALCDDDLAFSREKYDSAMKRFDDLFKGREFAIRNIALNLFFDLKMPLFSCERTIFENYAMFAACAGSIRLTGAVVAAMGPNAPDSTIENGFKYAISLVSRMLCHNATRTEQMFDSLREHGFNSPAYIAALIK